MDFVSAGIIEAAAGTVFTYAIERWGGGGRDKRRAFVDAFRIAYDEFCGRYPQLVESLFDSHFLQGRAKGLLAQCISRLGPPSPSEVVAAYVAHLGLTGGARAEHISELAPAAEYFLSRFMEALRDSGKFDQPLDSQALDTISQNSSAIAADVRGLREAIEPLLAKVVSQPDPTSADANSYAGGTPYSVLWQAVREAGSLLRHVPYRINGVHITRPDVQSIVEWALTADPKQPLAILFDQPGEGKTVVLHDVQDKLETTHQVSVLAIKADALSGITTEADLLMHLRLPEPIDACAQTIVRHEGLFVVLVDQIDALSLSMTRDQRALNVILAAIARLMDVSGVRIVASCRVFDLNNDPRLSSLDIGHTFSLQPIPDEELDRVLSSLGVDPSHITSTTRNLLRVPLHLDIYARIVGSSSAATGSAGEMVGARGAAPEVFQTLQQLYDALWQKYLASPPPAAFAGATAADRPVAAVYKMVEAMQAHHQVSIPAAVLDDFPASAAYLASTGLVKRENLSITFLHQTFFDYCFARRFVSTGSSLCEDVRLSTQGLFERSKVVQVLSFLRGTNERVYLKELRCLLFDDDIRFHIRHLVIGWLGSLPDPTNDELAIARRLVSATDVLTMFLAAAGGNEGWFDRLHSSGLLADKLGHGDDEVVNRITYFLNSMVAVDKRLPEVLRLLKPYVGRNVTWDRRLAMCLGSIRSWESGEALELLCQLLRRGSADVYGEGCLSNLAKSNVLAGLRAAAACLDGWLERVASWKAEEQAQAGSGGEATSSSLVSSVSRMRVFHPEIAKLPHALGDLLQKAVADHPLETVEQLLPWFARAVTRLSEERYGNEYFPEDPLFTAGWYERDNEFDAESLPVMLATALSRLASEDPGAFRNYAAVLMSVESTATQRLIAHAYLAASELYSSEIADFLLADRRRLHLGDIGSLNYESYRLFSEAFKHADEPQRRVLEEYILGWKQEWERRAPKYVGREHLSFLQSIPRDLLSNHAKGRLQELERKFPEQAGANPLEPPKGIIISDVEPPIPPRAYPKMTDEHWLSAMHTYKANTEGNIRKRRVHPFGGVEELSGAFSGQVEANPERFYKLGYAFDDKISPHYIAALIGGLARSEGPAEWVFDTVRRFLDRIPEEFRTALCQSLERRANDGVPDDLLDTMEVWARSDPDPDGSKKQSDDLLTAGINSTRGFALDAVCACALALNPPQLDRVTALLEHTASDPSCAVRAVATRRLLFILDNDRERALGIFDEMVKGCPELLGSTGAYKVVYYNYYSSFGRVRPYIEQMMVGHIGRTREMGAVLACLSAFRNPEAEELATQAIGGDEAQRIGAAKAYAQNAGASEIWDKCEMGLRLLMNDESENVRKEVGRCFLHLGPEDIDNTRHFIRDFLVSSSLSSGALHLSRYLQAIAVDEHELALRATAAILDTVDAERSAAGVNSSLVPFGSATSRLISDDELVSLPLIVYTNTIEEQTKKEAMDLFERLLRAGSYKAYSRLDEWDRR